MREGFTTGSCAAAAARAGAWMLLTGSIMDRVDILTPRGAVFQAEIIDISRSEGSVRCGVVKDGGDDPDVTTGAVVYAEVSLGEGPGGTVEIDGGEGVGRVTKPGLDQPVGSAAINSVPREMIRREVTEVMENLEQEGSLKVVISVPGGAEIAERTFNPRLGIEGGISILGTSGIVEPMSTRAVIDTVNVELSQKRALGRRIALLSPGNYGADSLRENFGIREEDIVICSNYIGEAIDSAAGLGFSGLLLCGHLGKLIKLSGGIMNTHSREADCRMELMVSAGLRSGMDRDRLVEMLDCVTTDAAYEIVISAGCEEKFMETVMDRIHYYMEKRAAGRLRTGCLVFSEAHGLLGATEGALDMLEGGDDE